MSSWSTPAKTDLSVASQTTPSGEPYLYDPVAGYDAAAEFYDSWHWQAFWHQNELPLVDRLVDPFVQCVDIGCGTGTYARLLSAWGAVIGVDPSIEMLKKARATLPAAVALKRGCASDVPLPSACADLVLTARCLAHEPHLGRAVCEIARITSPGGSWIVTEVHPGHRYPCTRIPSQRGDILIRTHKRSPLELIAAAESSRLFALVSQHVLGWRDLAWKPQDDEFSRIDRSGSLPVFFVLKFARLGRA